MMTMLQTIVQIPEFSSKIKYGNKISMVGSCFTENIGNRLRYLKYDAMVNPYGIMYNPLSVKQCIEGVLSNKKFQTDELVQQNGLWHSFSHHGSFSGPDADKVIESINEANSKAHNHLLKSQYIFITFGTARVYRHIDKNRLVANCHKIPQSAFRHELLEADYIVKEYTELINHVLTVNPEIKIVFTVSPVRHWKDGATGNMVSKASLILAIHNLLKECSQCSYFPSYEIFMDELRDYRFYDTDMLHPSEAGINYIWNRFEETFMDKSQKDTRKRIEKIQKSLAHKPLHDQDELYSTFLKRILEEIASINAVYPEILFDAEKQNITEVLNGK